MSSVIWLAHHCSLSHGQTPGGGTREALCSTIYVLLAPDENILATLCLLEHEEQRDDLFSVTCLGHLENWLRSHPLHCRPEQLFIKVCTVSFIIFLSFVSNTKDLIHGKLKSTNNKNQLRENCQEITLI